ncbi:MAG: cupin domain-containing protein [Actinobacteria bacterium]|nr:cupin domain-containing protein [Actinomycetota bacterium]
MIVASINEIPEVPWENPLFTSKEVTSQKLIPESRDYLMSVVNFGKGVRNKFHTHESDQILIITKGKGIVATENEQRLVCPGDIVLFPAGEKHWHGATDDSEFSHIYIIKAGAKTTQLED